MAAPPNTPDSITIRPYVKIRDAARAEIAARKEFERMCLEIIREAEASEHIPVSCPDEFFEKFGRGEGGEGTM